VKRTAVAAKVIAALREELHWRAAVRAVHRLSWNR
jgi:hypothetical protein